MYSTDYFTHFTPLGVVTQTGLIFEQGFYKSLKFVRAPIRQAILVRFHYHYIILHDHLGSLNLGTKLTKVFESLNPYIESFMVILFGSY